MSPQSIFTLQLKFGTLMIETHTVMTLRLMGMAGLIPARPGENARMVNEKGPAMIMAYAAATDAIMKGQRPEQIMHAAMTPVSQRVRSNRKRLSG